MRFPWSRGTGPDSPSPQGSREAVPSVSPNDLQRTLLSTPAPYVVDVRSPGEYARGHIPGARSIPLGTLATRLGELPKDEPVTVVCLSGHRSHQAASLLLRSGFPSARHMAGGMLRWKGPIEKGQG